MAKYIAYNKMYKKGKSLGRAFKTNVGTSKENLKKSVIKDNLRWNRVAGKGEYRVKLFSIKRR